MIEKILAQEKKPKEFFFFDSTFQLWMVSLFMLRDIAHATIKLHSIDVHHVLGFLVHFLINLPHHVLYKIYPSDY